MQPRLLVASQLARGGRTVDHPVAAGALLAGTAVYFYVQEAVPGIAPTPQCLSVQECREGRSTRIVRFRMDVGQLKELTAASWPQ